MKCSVIICTHNPREEYLRRVLDGLRAQTLPFEQWEMLLIDNASPTPLSGRFDLSWHPHGRHVREDKLGLTPARLRGISESKADFLVFIDDDNILKQDYLEAAVSIGFSHPWLGTWGGSCIPEFEAQPSADITPWLGCLALYKATAPLWAMLRTYSEACPCGAGMVVRRNLALHYQHTVSQNPARQKLDRTGAVLSSGGDVDLALTGFDLGLGTGRFPQLELTHIIPAGRLKVEYLAKIVEGFGYSEIVLGLAHQPGYQAPIQKRSRLWLTRLFLMLKPSTARRIELAGARGKFRAYQDFKKMGYFHSSESKEATSP